MPHCIKFEFLKSNIDRDAKVTYGVDHSAVDAYNPSNISRTVTYTINTVGKVNLTELPDEPDDVLSKNMLNVYLIGSGLDSNLLNTDGYLPITLKDKQRSVIRK